MGGGYLLTAASAQEDAEASEMTAADLAVEESQDRMAELARTEAEILDAEHNASLVRNETTDNGHMANGRPPDMANEERDDVPSLPHVYGIGRAGPVHICVVLAAVAPGRMHKCIIDGN
jgi:hypothetical protein